MEVHFQKSIFGNLVPNGPYIEVLPGFEVKIWNLIGFKTIHASQKYECALVRAFRNFAKTAKYKNTFDLFIGFMVLKTTGLNPVFQRKNWF